MITTLGSGYRVGCSYWWKYWLSPRSYYNCVKWNIQRASRGWADCDTWSLDSYLSEWLPDALRHLKKHKHGTPCSMYEPGELNTVQPDGCTWAGEAGDERASKKWDAAMDKMIEGFEALNRANDGLYEKELGPYPLEPDWIENMNKPWSKEKEERFRRSQELEKADMAKFKEGVALFVEHFQSLWD